MTCVTNLAKVDHRLVQIDDMNAIPCQQVAMRLGSLDVLGVLPQGKDIGAIENAPLVHDVVHGFGELLGHYIDVGQARQGMVVIVSESETDLGSASRRVR